MNPMYEKCGFPAEPFIPREGKSFACVLQKGHTGEHKGGGNCVIHGKYIGVLGCPYCRYGNIKYAGISPSLTPFSIADGGIKIDDRGTLSAFNSVDFSKVKRMYMVENFSTQTVRAFHGHKIEEKQAIVVSGSALFVIAPLRFDGDKPFLTAGSSFVLSSKNPQILRIPAGYANGFRALEERTKILFFSSTTLEEAARDDYRLPWDEIGFKIWETENR